MARYYDLDKLSKLIEARADTMLEGKCAMLYVAKWLNLLPTVDVEEKKDCEKCIHFGKYATEYPCSHCRNCYTDKFQPNDTRTPKERGGEK